MFATVMLRDVIVVITMVLLAALLRVHQYSTVPGLGYTEPPGHVAMDEYAYAWAGMSLLSEGQPKSWSYLPAYEKSGNRFGIRTEFNTIVPMVRPYLDHPPAMSVLLGTYLLLAGERGLPTVKLEVLRIPALILGILAVLLLYVTARVFFGFSAAFFSTLIYASWPSLVLSSRLALAENLMVVLALAAVLLGKWAVVQGDRRGGYVTALLAGLMAGLAVAAKLTGIFIAVFLVCYFLRARRYSHVLNATVAILILAAVYPVLGWYYDWDLFLEVLHSHKDRFGGLVWLGLLINSKMILQPSHGFGHQDPWLLFCWLSLLVGYRNAAIFQLPVLLYTAVLTFSGAFGHWYYWYIIPLFPFLSLAAGCSLAKHYRVANPALQIALALMVTLKSWQMVAFMEPSLGLMPLEELSWQLLFCAVLMMGPAMLHWVCQGKVTGLIARFSTIALVGISTVLNVLVVWHYRVL